MLATKYRPKEFTDVTEQEVTIRILQKQIDTKAYSHSMLFAGPAGCGKTTCARIFADKVNGETLELDCASNNGVADVEEIIERAKKKPLLADYKVVIFDECQTLSNQAWASLLITLEATIPTAIFIFCTTDSQKLPDTIISRMPRFNFLPISEEGMKKRIKQILEIEGNHSFNDTSLDYIVRGAKGNLRQALTNIDKCILYGTTSTEDVCKVLNIVSPDVMKDLYDAIGDRKKIIEIVENVYKNGYELSQFVSQFLEYCIPFGDTKVIDRLLTILQDIRYNESPKFLIIAHLIVIER